MTVRPRSIRLLSLLFVLPLVIVMGSSVSSAAPVQHSTSPGSPKFSQSFVVRSGARLYVAGRPFRFGGANIEWLGLAGYGPFDPNGPHFPSNYEIDDAMATPRVETGQWWALYYTGIATLVNTAADMAARAQVLRRHNYVMRGMRLPAHAIPPPPIVTSAVYGPTSQSGRLGTRIYWQGSAGAMNYSVQRANAAAGPWTTVCRRCVTDLDDGYVDEGGGAEGAWYRVVPYNLGGRPGRASNSVKASTG